MALTAPSKIGHLSTVALLQEGATWQNGAEVIHKEQLRFKASRYQINASLNFYAQIICCGTIDM
jgi:hypothetical protein